MESFSASLLTWYDRNARTLPWRVSPADGKLGIVPDPYHVWLSEVMLQQTTVATVKSYFEKFVNKWPSVQHLAAVSQDDVMKEWAGLGYYSRARNLKACADIVAKDYGGKFPETQAQLIGLPGVGDYTSAAIAAIAFGEKTAVVDGNIERVVSRCLANPIPLPKLKDICRVFMLDHTPEDRPGDFVQAMMDLGATICIPKTPVCALCPFNEKCAAFKAGSMLEFPVKVPKKAKPTRKGAAFVCVRSDGSVWLERRPDSGLLGGMSIVPTTGWTASVDGETGIGSAPFESDWRNKGLINHTFTHFHLELEVWHAEVEQQPNGDGWWSAPSDLPDEALPTVFKKVVTAARPNALKKQKELAP